MSELVERVARAIAEGLAVDYGAQDGGYQAQLRQAARAALAAMREPTEAMIEAGADAWMWRAMIDAAVRDV